MSNQRWRPSEMPSMTGTTAVVTGANSGIGWHTALELARHGASVTMAVRSKDKGDEAAQRIRDAVPDADVHVAELDLGSLESVESFADSWHGPLGLLVNNAGVMSPPRYRQSADGYELQFATNHLGHFALTGRLLPSLLRTPSARVVTVASIAHHSGKATVINANPPSEYNPSTSYGNTKLANLLFFSELQRRASQSGTSLTSTAAHPGVSVTNLVSSQHGLGSIPGVKQLWPIFGRVLFQSAEAGAEPTLYAATVAEPGSYTGPQGFRETRGAAGPARLGALARDEELAGKLWEVSEEMTGVRYDWDSVA